jgi:hypothetical protein
MGVSAVQGCDACKMLSLQSTKEELPFLQPTDLLYFDTYWYILVRTLYILVHTWSVLSIYKGIQRMILLCFSCAGYCTGNSNWLFHHILTASRKITMMLPWKTVGLHDPCSSSAATCTQRTEDCLRLAATRQAQTISLTSWFSSAPLRSLRCQSKDPWKMLGWSSFMNHPRHHASTWLLQRTWWVESP